MLPGGLSERAASLAHLTTWYAPKAYQLTSRTARTYDRLIAARNCRGVDAAVVEHGPAAFTARGLTNRRGPSLGRR